jgi:hypothetical protein
MTSGKKFRIVRIDLGKKFGIVRILRMTRRAMFIPINVTDVKQNERRFLTFFFMFCVCILRSLYKIMDVFLH